MAKKPIIWVSAAMINPSLIKGFKPDFWLQDERRALDAVLQNDRGEALPKERFPSEFYAKYKDKREKRQPDLIRAGGFWVVSSACAALLREFDLGDGSLYPTKLLQHDRGTPVEGEYFCLNFGNQLDAVLPGQSKSIREVTGQDGMWKSPWVLQDNDITVSAEALAGPDLWVDPHMMDAFFLSDALSKALRAEKLSGSFRLRKCVVA